MGILKLKKGPNKYEMFTLQFMGIADLKLTAVQRNLIVDPCARRDK